MFPTEMMQNSCMKSDQTGMTTDPRYIDTNLYTNEYDVQYDNQVLAILTSLPGYSSKVPNYVQ